MEGSERQSLSGRKGRWRLGAAFDVVRFVLGLAFIILGAGLLLEGTIGSLYGSRLLFPLDGVNRAFEFFVGLMAVSLGGLLVAGIREDRPETNRAAWQASPDRGLRSG